MTWVAETGVALRPVGTEGGVASTVGAGVVGVFVGDVVEGDVLLQPLHQHGLVEMKFISASYLAVLV